MAMSWITKYLILWMALIMCNTVPSNALCTSDTDCLYGGTCITSNCMCTDNYFGENCGEMKAIVGFAETMITTDEGSTRINVGITRDGNTALPVEVKIMAVPAADRLMELQADIIQDYRLPNNINPATEGFMPGMTQKALNIDIINDDDIEGDQYFGLELRVTDTERARVQNDNAVVEIKIISRDGNSGCNEMGENRECFYDGVCFMNGTCICTPRYIGEFCNVVNPCFPNPCLNAGMCKLVDNGFMCDCSQGYSGDTCTDAVTDPPPPPDPCAPDPCNGGICLNNGGMPNCDCTPTGLTGETCTDQPGGGNGDGGSSNNQNGNLTTTIIAASVVGVVVLIIFIIAVVFLVRRSNRKNATDKRTTGQPRDNTYAEGRVVYQNERGQTRNGNTQNHKGRHRRQGTVYDKAERKIGAEFPRQSLKLHEHLGSGAFANVYRADAMGIVKRRVQTVVAVKMLKEMATDTDRSDFLKELKVYRMLEPHPNVIVMLGCCTDKEPYYLIMEYAPHGSLQSHLRGIRNAPESPYGNVEGERREHLTPTEILQFGSQIANGMKYLASKMCIHRDLATRNILLGDGLMCKLSDFGLARDISEENSYEMQSRGRIPVRWMAIESLLENSYTSKSDVWSFGVTMWELVTLGSHPYPGMSSKKVISELQKGYRLPKPDHCSQEIYSMMKECWEARPEKRPGFDRIHRKLDGMLEDANGYLQMTELDRSDYMYLDPNAPDSDSDVENDEHGEV